ncbi:hypothetical protein B0F90DRAFT_1664786 [Multifurca ochricompacta]|uniref:Uncharacterized protein n=1 Tax=Multifurca ochricompacta TaxID=376703 RepID=A0AAD4MCD2_9AGAM|nr:hypothetical protein B0F90DRAFT_1664786 [Multifurca ochricompacta]
MSSASTAPPRRSSSKSANTITKGATARSAVNPRVSASLNSPRRPSIKSLTPPPIILDAPNVLTASLERETEEKERLLVQLQNKDQTITNLTEEIANVSTALNTAEARLYEFYTEQARVEEEMSARIEVAEKLRAQVRELEKEKRDLHRRYNEQTATFEAERQAFYDNEQHLKSRIQSLTQARRRRHEPDTEEEEEEEEPVQPYISQEKEDLHAEPVEMTALRLELSTLSTSYASLQNTLVLLQTQLVDLKRVNNQLQEENESYNILLREKTLSGQYGLFRQVNGDMSNFSDEDGQTDDIGDVQSMRSGAPSSQLGTVDEHPDEGVLHTNFGTDRGDLIQSSDDEGSLGREGSNRVKRSRHGRGRHGGSSHSPAPRGESLAGLPITGPGLDLAAELGRAENKDILDGGHVADVPGLPKDKRGKKGLSESRKTSTAEPGIEHNASLNEVDSLRSEIKSLKDANKALSLYASKIIDRIIAQEGFEHVLAVDYEPKTPATPTTTIASPYTSGEADKKPKRRNTMFARSDSNPPPRIEKLTTFDSPPTSISPPSRSNRRSLSFDWRAFSPFVSGDKDKKPEVNPNLRPLTLKPGSISGARKLETLEDEEDRKERERLNATMKLMGIEKPSVPPPIQKSYSTPETPTTAVESVPNPSFTSRFSFFRRATAPSDVATDLPLAASQGNPISLTHDTLARAQAEESLAGLDAQERILGAELAKGGNGGFTEILPHRKSGSRRSVTSGGGSGSTVWSAGRAGEDD